MVLMVCCAVPAFADDTVTKNDLSSVKWSIVSKSSDIPHFTDVYNYFQSTISKTDNYIAVYGKKSDGTSATPRSEAPTNTITSGLLVIIVQTCDTRSVIVDTPEVIAVVSPVRTVIGILFNLLSYLIMSILSTTSFSAPPKVRTP